VSTASNPASLRRLLLKIVVIGLLLRVSGMVLMHSYRVKLDFDEGAHIAAAIASGQGFSNPFGPATGPTAWLGPLFPFVLSRFFIAFGTYTPTAIFWVLVFNCTVSALTCVPIYFVARYTFGERIAARSAWVWALFPYTMYWGMRHPWDTPLSAFLFALCFMATVHLAESSTLLKWAGYGLLWGIAGLCNTAELVFLPFAGCWICYRQFRQGKPFFRNAVAGAVLFFAVIAPGAFAITGCSTNSFRSAAILGSSFISATRPTPWEPGNRSSILRKTYWSCGSIRRWGRLPTSTANWR